MTRCTILRSLLALLLRNPVFPAPSTECTANASPVVLQRPTRSRPVHRASYSAGSFGLQSFVPHAQYEAYSSMPARGLSIISLASLHPAPQPPSSFLLGAGFVKPKDNCPFSSYRDLIRPRWQQGKPMLGANTPPSSHSVSHHALFPPPLPSPDIT